MMKERNIETVFYLLIIFFFYLFHQTFEGISHARICQPELFRRKIEEILFYLISPIIIKAKEGNNLEPTDSIFLNH